MQKKPDIALFGGAKAGKSSIARALETLHGYYTLHYSNLLKNFAQQMLATIGVDIATLPKETLRPFLQALGDVSGFSQGNYLADMVGMARTIQPATPLVIDCLRTPGQAVIARDLGFLVVEVAVPTEVRLERARADGEDADQLLRNLQHPIESQQVGFFHIEVDGRDGPNYNADVLAGLNLQAA